MLSGSVLLLSGEKGWGSNVVVRAAPPFAACLQTGVCVHVRVLAWESVSRRPVLILGSRMTTAEVLSGGCSGKS